MIKAERITYIMNSENNILPNAKKPIAIYTVVMGVLSLLGISLRTVALFLCYDSDIGYYIQGAALPRIFNLVCVFAVLVSMSAMFLLPKNREYPVLPATSLTSKVGAIFASAATASHSVYLLISMNGAFKISALDVVSILFSLGAFVYYLSLLSEKAAASNARVMLGYCVIFHIAVILASSYFDFNTTMNNPNKLLMQVALMTAMIYMLCELRYALGIQQPRAYVALSLMTVFFNLVCALPGFIAFFSGIFTNTEYLFSHFVCFGFGIYTLTRFISMAGKNIL